MTPDERDYWKRMKAHRDAKRAVEILQKINLVTKRKGRKVGTIIRPSIVIDLDE